MICSSIARLGMMREESLAPCNGQTSTPVIHLLQNVWPHFICDYRDWGVRFNISAQNTCSIQKKKGVAYNNGINEETLVQRAKMCWWEGLSEKSFLLAPEIDWEQHHFGFWLLWGFLLLSLAARGWRERRRALLPPTLHLRLPFRNVILMLFYSWVVCLLFCERFLLCLVVFGLEVNQKPQKRGTGLKTPTFDIFYLVLHRQDDDHDCSTSILYRDRTISFHALNQFVSLFWYFRSF